MSDETECELCGDPATKTTVDGVPVCDGDYDMLLDQMPSSPDGDLTPTKGEGA